MKIRSIFYDNRGIFRDMWVPVLLILFWAAMFFMIWGFMSILDIPRSPQLEKRANFVAMCKSAGGEMGETACYKNGELIYKLEEDNEQKSN